MIWSSSYNFQFFSGFCKSISWISAKCFAVNVMFSSSPMCISSNYISLHYQFHKPTNERFCCIVKECINFAYYHLGIHLIILLCVWHLLLHYYNENFLLFFTSLLYNYTYLCFRIISIATVERSLPSYVVSNFPGKFSSYHFSLISQCDLYFGRSSLPTCSQ